MTMKLHGLFAAGLLALAPLFPASAAVMTYDAVLNGASEQAPNLSPGVGAALVTIDGVLNTMRVQVEFSGLTAGVTASHIHCCTAVANTGTAIVATPVPTFPGFPSGVTSGVYDRTFDLLASASYNPAFIAANGGTAATAATALLAGLGTLIVGGDSTAYLNIHTTAFPSGEIRGFVRRCETPSGIPTKMQNPCESVASVPEPPALALLALAALVIVSFGFGRLKEI
jgi:hypothetical protein